MGCFPTPGSESITDASQKSRAAGQEFFARREAASSAASHQQSAHAPRLGELSGEAPSEV
jgi:hypothetical protein